MESPIDQYVAPQSVAGKPAAWKNFFCDRGGQNLSDFTFLNGKQQQKHAQATQNIPSGDNKQLGNTEVSTI